MRTEFSAWLRQKQHQRIRNATTIQMYEQQIMGFEGWLYDALGLPLAPETISHYRMHAYLCYLQTTLQRAPVSANARIPLNAKMQCPPFASYHDSNHNKGGHDAGAGGRTHD